MWKGKLNKIKKGNKVVPMYIWSSVSSPAVRWVLYFHISASYYPKSLFFSFSLSLIFMILNKPHCS